MNRNEEAQFAALPQSDTVVEVMSLIGDGAVKSERMTLGELIERENKSKCAVTIVAIRGEEETTVHEIDKDIGELLAHQFAWDSGTVELHVALGGTLKAVVGRLS